MLASGAGNAVPGEAVFTDAEGAIALIGDVAVATLVGTGVWLRFSEVGGATIGPDGGGIIVNGGGGGTNVAAASAGAVV